MDMEQKPENKKGNTWTLEPAMFVFFYGWFLSTTIVENQVLKQTCVYSYQYDEDICNNLDDKNKTLAIEQEIQPYALNVLMTLMVTNAIIPMVLNLFLSPWSDKFGRKKVLNLVTSGYTVSMGLIAAVSYTADYIKPVSPWLYYIAQLPGTFCGGMATFSSLSMCYIIDLTDEDSRSRRFMALELVIFVGVLFAFASSSFILKATNPTTVFAISFACILIGTLSQMIFVKEPVAVKEGVSVKDQLKEIFTLTRVKDLYLTCTKSRPLRYRRILVTLASVMVIIAIVIQGTQTVFYYFVRQAFGWTQQSLTFYTSAVMMVEIIGSIVVMSVLKPLLCLPDLTLASMSMMSALVDALIKLFATETYHFYIAAATSILKLTAAPMIRTTMSTIVEPDEVSKVYSLLTAFESISSLVSAPIYKAIYSATLKSFPSAFYIATSGVYIISLVLIALSAKWLQLPRVNTKTCDTRL